MVLNKQTKRQANAKGVLIEQPKEHKLAQQAKGWPLKSKNECLLSN